MKQMAIAVLLMVSTLTVLAEGKTNLLLQGGIIYTNVTVTRVEPDGLTIMTSKGVQRIPFSNLSEEVRAVYGYDPEKAAEHAKKIVANQQATAQIKAKKYQVEQVARLVCKIYGKVVQKMENGLLVRCKTEEEYTQEVREFNKGKMAAFRSMSGSDGRGGTWTRKAPDMPNLQDDVPPQDRTYGTILLVGHPKEEEQVDRSTVTISGYPAGTYSYTDVNGATRTVKRYATSPQMAITLMAADVPLK